MNETPAIFKTLPAGYTRGDSLGKHGQAVEAAHAEIAKQPPGGLREKLYALEIAVGGMPEVECPLQHVYAPGVYARTIFIPAGSVVVGKIHKHKHINVLSFGDVSVLTEGGGNERLRGPLTMASEPGTKRAVYAHTDVVWTTIHLTNETDLEKIEAETIAPTFADYEAFVQLKLEQGEQSCLG